MTDPAATALHAASAQDFQAAAIARSPRRMHLARAAVIGLCAGLLAVAFRHALWITESGRGELLTLLHLHPRWGWLVLPIIGLIAGAGVGWCTLRIAPEASGSGIPHLKGVLLHLRTLRWSRVIPVKFLAGAVGIGAGLSLGREGPTVQMGAAVARALAGPLGSRPSDLPQLLSAGAGAGLAAAFNAPLAGLLFVVEELHRELSLRTGSGALIAAVCATVVAQILAGDTPSFEVHGLASLPIAWLPLAVIVGGVGGLLGVLFNRSLLWGQQLALHQRRVPRWTLPGLAAMLTGLAAWWIPDSVGGGQAVAERVLGGSVGLGVGALSLLLLVKFVLSVTSYASGAPGGIFAPMLLIGTLCGTALGHGVATTFPAVAPHVQAMAVLGMAAIFVGSVRAPLTGIVLISEMTGGYDLLFPICISALTACLVGEGLRDRPIYEALLEADLERSGHGEPHAEPRTLYLGVQNGSQLAGVKIAAARLPRGCLIVGIERGGVNMLPTANTTLHAGDHVTLVIPGDRPEASLEIVRLCSGL